MQVKEGVVLAGLQPCMRHVLSTAEDIWKKHGQSDGVTVTSTVDGVHSAGSWHPYGYAVDLRTNSLRDWQINAVYDDLKKALPDFDVVKHATHIHVEIGNSLASRLGVLY